MSLPIVPRRLIEETARLHTFNYYGSPSIALRLADRKKKHKHPKFVLIDAEDFMLLHDLEATGSISLSQRINVPVQKYVIKGKHYNVSLPLLFAGAEARLICKCKSTNTLNCKKDNWLIFADRKGPAKAVREVLKEHAELATQPPIVSLVSALIDPRTIDAINWWVRD